MDVKGLKWAANIYQKFETLCLEVEEVVYQDTVKYMENQVQTVGASFKKFYSDVMEDLHPPSSLNPGKVTNSEFILEQFNHGEICKKPKPVIKKEPLKVDVGKLRKRCKAPGSMENNHVAVTSNLGTHGVDNPFPSPVLGSSEKVASSEICGPGSFNNGTRLKGLTEPAEASISVGKTDCQSTEVLKRNFKASHQENPSACLASSESAQHDLVGESTDETETINEAIPEPFVHSLTSNASLLESEFVQHSGRAKSLSSSEDFSVVSHAADIPCCNSTDYFGAPSINEDFCSNIHDEIGFSNLERATVDHSDEAKLEESCIFVNGDELQYVTTPGKSRPYKKKCQGALSSRRRASRAQEYKQLAAQFANSVKCNDERTSNSGMALSSTKSSGSSVAHDLGESEWELL